MGKRNHYLKDSDRTDHSMKSDVFIFSHQTLLAKFFSQPQCDNGLETDWSNTERGKNKAKLYKTCEVMYEVFHIFNCRCEIK